MGATAISAAAAPAAREGLGRWERLGASFCLAQCSEPFFNALAQSQGLTEAPGYARLAWAPVWLFMAWAVWRDRRAAAATLAHTPLLMALLGLAALSALWSIDPGASARRAIWLALTMSFGLYLAWRMSWREILEVCGWTWFGFIVGSAALALFAPSIGVMADEHPGAWAGLWTHKNMMGGIMALGVPLGIAAAMLSGRKRWLLLAALSFLMVLMSTSKTSLLASMLGLGVLGAGVIARRGPMQALVVVAGAGAAAIVAGSVFLLAPELIVSLIGRDLTFTGRTDIWLQAEHAVAARPVLGYGYYAFWLDPDGPAYAIRAAVGWAVPSAHSGWLDLALGLGGAGVALFALQLAATLRRGLIALADPVAGLWAPAFLAAFALYTMSESHVLEANNIFWTLYCAVTAKLARDAHARKTEAA